LKKSSVTTPLPIPSGGQRKTAVKIREVICAPYEVQNTPPILQTQLPNVEIRKVGRRPKCFDIGFQNKGKIPSAKILKGSVK
jgi:hypothetical protein